MNYSEIILSNKDTIDTRYIPYWTFQPNQNSLLPTVLIVHYSNKSTNAKERNIFTIRGEEHEQQRLEDHQMRYKNALHHLHYTPHSFNEIQERFAPSTLYATFKASLDTPPPRSQHGWLSLGTSRTMSAIALFRYLRFPGIPGRGAKRMVADLTSPSVLVLVDSIRPIGQ